jgi:ribosomal protein S27AE
VCVGAKSQGNASRSLCQLGDKKPGVRGTFLAKTMVKSWVCPKCLGDLNTFYTEEGDTMVATDKVVCPHCAFTLEGSVGECDEDVVHSGTRASDDEWHKQA